MNGPATNWARNITFTAQRFHRPASVGELQSVVTSSERARAVGTGHSFNRIADTPGDLVSIAGLPKIIEVDAGRSAVTVSAGVRYGELASQLQENGYALRNLGSLPHISVAGSCATGTHGSGDANGSLATAVSALEMVTAAGDVVALSRDADGDQFCGAVVALGSLGIVTRLTLDIVPTFDMRQYVYEDLPRGQVDEHFADIFSSSYSVSLFTDWQGSTFRQLWLKRRADEGASPAAAPAAAPAVAWAVAPAPTPAPAPPARWMGALLADGPRHPVPGMSPAACTQQLGVAGPWHERLPHFRLEFTPSSGEELQSEYLMPRQHAIGALTAIDRIRDRVAPALRICEIRTVASDDLWMSPCYQRDSVAFHFTWVKDTGAVTPVLAAIEDQLAPFEARPHWGKLFGTSPAAVSKLYERLPDFQRLLDEYDPRGKFRNELVDTYFPSGQ
jgi:alditol oxidase